MTYFQETQRIRQKWVLILFAIVIPISYFGLFMWFYALHKEAGSAMYGTGMFWMAVLMFLIVTATVWLVLGAKLLIEVDETEVRIRYFPFTKRDIPLADIERFAAETYKPMAEFGGWGVRFAANGKRAYSTDGNEGVRLHLKNGKEVMLGSKRASELEAALARATGRH